MTSKLTAAPAIAKPLGAERLFTLEGMRAFIDRNAPACVYVAARIGFLNGRIS